MDPASGDSAGSADAPPSAPGATSSATAKPRRIAIAFLGSRGDCQPFIALALGLIARGHRVKAFSNEMHRAFVEAYGIEFAAFSPQRVKLTGKQEQMQGLGHELFIKPHFATDLAVFVREVRRFSPEMLLCGSLVDDFCNPVGEVLRVPVMLVRLQNAMPNRSRLPMGIPSFPRSLGWANIGLWQFGYNLLAKADCRRLDAVYERVLGTRLLDGLSAQAIFETVSRVPAPNVLIGNPRVVLEALYGIIPRNVRVTGYWVMDAENQLNAAGAAQFGGQRARDELEAFLTAGEPPVYFGWGSMIGEQPEGMVLRAVGAAMAAGKRAVIVGGWAKLSMEKLQAAASSAGHPEVLAYAERNVAFAEQAPHEWLFPRCACVVHHGGSGTTASSLRSGVPTIITPVAVDQFDYALAIQRMGVGIGLRKLKHLSSKELGAAVAKACSSEAIRRRAAEVGEMLRNEDGVAEAVKEIEKAFVLCEIGEYRNYLQCVRDRQRELDAQPQELTPARISLFAFLTAVAVRRLRRFAAPRLRAAL